APFARLVGGDRARHGAVGLLPARVRRAGPGVMGMASRRGAPAGDGARLDAAGLLRDSSEGLLAQIRWFNRMRFAAVLAMTRAGTLAAAFGLVAAARPLFVMAAVAL